MKNKLLYLVLSLLLVSLLFSPNAFSQTPVVRVVPSSSTSPSVGERLTVDIVIENGRNVAGCQIALTFDQSALKYTRFTKGDYFPTDAFYGTRYTRNLLTKKRLRFAVASATESTGDGTIATLTFEVLQAKPSSFDLIVGTSSANSGTFFTSANGTLTFPRLESGTISADILDVYLPTDFTEELAFSQNLTYFIFNAQFPSGPYKDPGFPADIQNSQCLLTVHLPKDTITLIFGGWDPVAHSGDSLLEKTAILAGVNALEVVLPALDLLLEKLQTGVTYVNFDDEKNTVTFNMTNPRRKVPYIFLLLTNEVTSLKIEMQLKYQANFHWVNKELEGTWNLKTGSWESPAAPSLIVPETPAVQHIPLADWSPFQMLSPEVQAYLLEHFGEFASAEAWQIPEVTSVLPNYPNPFNPETWIPYQLAEPADVTVRIYDIHGHVVRDLDFGHQHAGVYQNKGRAAYWDGRNAQGEPVASGVYFYTLKAGDFSATRKMLIRK